MKQLAVKSNSKARVKEDNMLADYWAVKESEGVETFILSDKEFLNKYSSLKYFSSLGSIETFAVYQVDECSVCLKSFNVIINDRVQLKFYMQSESKYCRVCGHFKSSIENTNTL